MRRKALLGLLALFLHVAAPLLAQAAQQPAATIELCTAHGVVNVELAAGDMPAPAVPAGGHCDLCACHGLAASARPASTVAAAPECRRLAPRLQPFKPASPATASRPRAPPLAV